MRITLITPTCKYLFVVAFPKCSDGDVSDYANDALTVYLALMQVLLSGDLTKRNEHPIRRRPSRAFP